MKTYETRPRPASTYDHLTELRCDLCAKTTASDDWATRGTEVREVEVSLAVGSSYGHDGGDQTYTEFDICPECFKTKLIPWMESQGAKPRERSVDW